jgi:hypothetical protein
MHDVLAVQVLHNTRYGVRREQCRQCTGFTRRNTTQTIQYNATQYNTIQYNNTMQYNATQHNTNTTQTQYNTMQCNAIQCNPKRNETNTPPTDLLDDLGGFQLAVELILQDGIEQLTATSSEIGTNAIP